MSIITGVVVLAVGVSAVAVRLSAHEEIPWRGQELAARIAAGAAPLGSDDRPVPTGAFIVQEGAPEGGDGSVERPYARVADALDRVRAGGTIVLRAGVYREELFVGKSKTIELRAYPGEVVWFDGADVLDGWSRDGQVWRAPWPHEFSSAPSYTGGEDGTERTWQFLNDDHPFAAHPEQLWLDGSPLEQVAVDEVGPGSFAIDASAGQVLLGEDPAGRVVEASVRQRAVNLRSADSTITGIGFRRFAPSVPTLGTLVIEGDRARLSDVVVEDSSTTGIFVTGQGTVLDRVTVRRSGMIGVAANFADGFAMTGSLIERNNVEGFNQAPVSGGIKVTRSREVSIAASVVRGNAGPGIWLDQSVKNATISASDVLSNAGHGVFAEISDSVLLVDLVIAGNGRIGVKINDASRVRVWRSTVVGNGLGIAVLQDERRASDPQVPGHDERHPDDPDMTWVATGTVIADSIVGDVGGSPRDSDAQPAVPLWVHDYSGEFAADALVEQVSGNVLHRASGAPLILWQKGTGATVTYDDVARWEAAARAASGNVALVGAPPVDLGFVPTDAALTGDRASAALPDDVAVLLGPDADTRPGALAPYAPAPSGSPSPRLRRARGTSTRKRMARPPSSAPPAST